MKRFFFLFLILTSMFSFAQEEDEFEPLPNTMFSVEAAHHYNGYNKKNAINAKAYVWFLKRNSLGPEFHLYFPTSERNYFDYQIDFNFRRILVDFHPLTFDFLIGPAFRSTLDTYDENNDFIKGQQAETREWKLDGFNVGFGVNYRMGNHSIYTMPKINSGDSRIKITTGYKYHFDVSTDRVFNKRYKLNKKKRK